MTRSLRAIYQNGLLRPLEPLPLKENQQVTVTVSDQAEELSDAEFVRYLEADADDSVSIEQVRSALGKIKGSMVDDFRRERDED